MIKKRVVEIAPDIRDLLLRLRIEGNVVYIDQQLDRDTYARLNKVLEALGGKWNRKLRGHIFDGDATKKIAESLETGEAVDIKKTVEFYETPQAVANQLVAWAHLGEKDLVLEPSAGQGAIADVIQASCPECRIRVIEIEDSNREVLKERGYKLIGKDFLKYRKKKPLFDKIIMNPPFSGQQDIDHVNHAWRLLAPGGRLVSVMAAGVEFRENEKARKFRELVATHGLIEPLPPESFAESGTTVSTVIVVLDKPKKV